MLMVGMLLLLVEYLPGVAAFVVISGVVGTLLCAVIPKTER